MLLAKYFLKKQNHNEITYSNSCSVTVLHVLLASHGIMEVKLTMCINTVFKIFRTN